MGKYSRHGHSRSQVNGMKASPTYMSWYSMINRCTEEKDRRGYKKRGITVCERWLSFDNFLADMGERPPDKTSLDRIDNNGNYEPGNCRWATQLQQVRNSRLTKLSFNDVVEIAVRRQMGQLQREIADHFGVTQCRISQIERSPRWKEARLKGIAMYRKRRG